MSSNSPTNDWFVSAILKDGTVSQCLLEVEGELGVNKNL